LLTFRRRFTVAAGTMKRLILPLVFVLVALGGVGMAVAGVIQFRNVTTGPITRAKVDDCEIPTTGTVETCTGTWVVGGRRYSGKIDGAKIDDIDHTVKVRAHGNSAEYLAVTVFLLAFLELQHVDTFWLHVCGGIVVASRVVHSLSMLFKLRVSTISATVTYAVSFFMAFWSLYLRLR